MIDWTRVHELREEVGAETFPEVVAMFFEESDEVIGRLRTAVGSRSAASDTGADLHLLRGSAANLGFEALAQLCAAAECGGRAEAEQRLDSILRCYALSREAFQNGLTQPAWA